MHKLLIQKWLTSLDSNNYSVVQKAGMDQDAQGRAKEMIQELSKESGYYRAEETKLAETKEKVA